MSCPQCRHSNPPVAKFCSSCGAKLDSRCRACGHGNAPGSRFCNECGGPLTAAATPPSAAPEQYTPQHLAERILTSRSAIEGERKQVTVLFADLKGSSAAQRPRRGTAGRGQELGGASAVRCGMTSAVNRSIDAAASASRMLPNISRQTT